MSTKAAKNPEMQFIRILYPKDSMERFFVNDFNIATYHPKKDQCILCATWKPLAIDDDEKQKRASEKRDHDRQRALAEFIKTLTKAECQADVSRRMTTFDLEAVLQLPCGQVSQLYYKRKLILCTILQCMKVLLVMILVTCGLR